jgi:hypothetical protein
VINELLTLRSFGRASHARRGGADRGERRQVTRVIASIVNTATAKTKPEQLDRRPTSLRPIMDTWRAVTRMWRIADREPLMSTPLLLSIPHHLGKEEALSPPEKWPGQR